MRRFLVSNLAVGVAVMAYTHPANAHGLGPWPQCDFYYTCVGDCADVLDANGNCQEGDGYWSWTCGISDCADSDGLCTDPDYPAEFDCTLDDLSFHPTI